MTNANILFRAALAYHRAGQPSQAEALYRRILSLQPHHHKALHRLGIAAYKRGQHQIAIELIKRAQQVHKNSIYYLDCGLAYLALEQYNDAISCFQLALNLNCQLADAYYYLGYTYSLQGKAELAISTCLRALVFNPSHAEALNNLGFSYISMGLFDQAIGALRHAIFIKPNYTKSYYNLAIAFVHQGERQQAITSYQCAISIQPLLPEGYANLGNVYAGQGQLDEALSCYHRSLHIKNSCGVLFHLGNIFSRQDKADEAIIAYQQALAIQPNSYETNSELGNILSKAGKHCNAITYYQHSIAINPSAYVAYLNLGNALGTLGMQREAVDNYQKALVIYPNLAEAHLNIGIIFQIKGDLDQAFRTYQQALITKPDYAEAYYNLGNAAVQKGQSYDAVYYLQKALALRSDYPEALDSLCIALLYQENSSLNEIYATHLRYANQCEKPFKHFWPIHIHDAIADRCLKVGYVSPDFNFHAVSHFIEPVLAHHDKSQIEIYGYYNHTIRDVYTKRIASYVNYWRPCSTFSDEQLAQCIREDRIDILIDLAGHTSRNRLLTFARKPAPVQISYLGYVATTGLTAMDYRFTTIDMDPLGSDIYNTETLYRLPHAPWCYRPPSDAPDVSSLTPAEVTGYITFASMNNFAKISKKTLALWIDILHTVPQSRLLMISVPEGKTRLFLRNHFAAHDISSQRLILYDRVSLRKFRELHHQVDIALDPFPHNGNTTTCESLWMGVPVISLCGIMFVSRFGFAILKTLGLTELIAHTPDDYVRIACHLAQDTIRLSHLRGSLRQRFNDSSLRNEVCITRDIELAYRSIWNTWCQSMLR